LDDKSKGGCDFDECNGLIGCEIVWRHSVGGGRLDGKVDSLLNLVTIPTSEREK
jgi:hypothetical protein